MFKWDPTGERMLNVSYVLLMITILAFVAMVGFFIVQDLMKA